VIGGQVPGKVLVIGAQGVLGSFLASALREAGWEVVRGGRRPEVAGDFALVDLDRPETVADACAQAAVVISTVRDRRLVAERAVLSDGGILIHLNDLPAQERAALQREVSEPRGLVVDRTGIGGVANMLTARELLDEHPEADTVEVGLTVWANATSGRASASFLHSMLERPPHHATRLIDLPEPFGERRCIELGPSPATESLLRQTVGARQACLYVCFWPRAFGALFVALNGARLLSRLPRSAFTLGRGRVPKRLSREPFCRWASVLSGEERLGTRFVRGDGESAGTVAATVVCAKALAKDAGEPSRTGVFGVEELLALGDLEPALAHHGITIEHQTNPASVTAREL
jgi:hypothetical protein